MAVKIYTKTGDKGQTSLFGGQRVSKASMRVDAYGTVDELNSAVGVVLACMGGVKQKPDKKEKKVVDALQILQHDLLTIGSSLATPSSVGRIDAGVLGKRVKDFENLIDKLTEQLPLLRHFILPGGGLAGAELHVARTLARRAERRIIALSQEEEVDKNILIYFNRLSDLLFTMARYVNMKEKQPEQVWKK